MDNISGSPMTLSKTPTFLQAQTLTYDGSNELDITGNGALNASIGFNVSASTLRLNGNYSGTYTVTKSGAGTIYIKKLTSGDLTVSLGGASCNSMRNLSLANTANLLFTVIDHPTNGIITAMSGTANLGGACKIGFSWVAGSSRFTYMTVGSTCILQGVGMNFS